MIIYAGEAERNMMRRRMGILSGNDLKKEVIA